MLASEPPRLFPRFPRRGSDSPSISLHVNQQHSCSVVRYIISMAHRSLLKLTRHKRTKQAHAYTKTKHKEQRSTRIQPTNSFCSLASIKWTRVCFFACLEADAGGLEGLGSPAAALGKPSTAVCARHAHARPRRAPGLYPSPPPNPSAQPLQDEDP